MMGLHPTSVNDNPRWREELALVERYLETPPAGIRFCAVGEIGLDLYWSRDFRAEQLEAFRRQIDLSLEYGLPIAVHTRDAWPETVELMREYKGRGVRGVFHAFSDTADTYRELKEYGDFVFGIGGVVTFKKSKLADAVRDSLLAEEQSENAPHFHAAPIHPEPIELGFDRSWLYIGPDGWQSLLLVEGNVVASVEGPADFTDPAVLDMVRARLELEKSPDPAPEARPVGMSAPVKQAQGVEGFHA